MPLMLQLAASEMAPTDLHALVNCSPLKWEGFPWVTSNEENTTEVKRCHVYITDTMDKVDH